MGTEQDDSQKTSEDAAQARTELEAIKATWRDTSGDDD